jgi:hypothetical protein
MPLKAEISGSSIVLIGSFNPAIFHPQWFARQGLISDSEADNATIKISVPQVSHFETEGFIMQVVPERFSVTSQPNANPAALQDLVSGAFYILEHTPVTGIGLNRHLHIAMESEDDWNRLGDRLAPKDGWNRILEGAPACYP